MSLDRLPDAARARYVALEAAANDARALYATVTERIGKAQTKLLVLRQQNKETMPTGTRATELAGAIAQVEAELALLSTQQRERSEKHDNAAQIVAQLKHFVQTLPPDAVLEDAALSAPGALRRGDNAAAAVERTRADLAAAQQELAQLMFAPPTHGEIEKQIIDYVERLRRAGSPLVNSTHERGLVISFFGVQPNMPAPAIGPAQVAALLAWLDPNKFTEQLIGTLAAMPSSGAGVSARERKTRSAALVTTIERLERQEESIIERAASDGVELLRRPTASVAAVLGVRAVSSRVAAVVAA